MTKKWTYYSFAFLWMISQNVIAQVGERKQHLTLYDTFFGNEQDYQVCYPKDHRGLFYMIIIFGAAATIMFGLIIYIKTKSNKALKHKNEIIQEKNQELLDSITYAKRIQNTLLPDPQVIRANQIPCEVIYHPRDIVSGDLFWIHKEKNLIYYAVIDCTGHGVPGAFLSLLSHNAINKAVIEMELSDPSEILHTMNDYVKMVLKQSAKDEIKDGMEIGLCVVDMEHQLVKYAGAGIKLYYSQSDQLHEIKAAKCSVGAVQPHVTQRPQTHQIQLNKKDRLFLHSDGIIDQFGGEKAKKFSSKQLKQLIESTLKNHPAEQKETIEKTFMKWKGNIEQTDDVLFLLVEL